MSNRTHPHTERMIRQGIKRAWLTDEESCACIARAMDLPEVLKRGFAPGPRITDQQEVEGSTHVDLVQLAINKRRLLFVVWRNRDGRPECQPIQGRHVGGNPINDVRVQKSGALIDVIKNEKIICSFRIDE